MKYISFHIAVFLLAITQVSGQKACFDADVTKGCAPLTVNFISCAPATGAVFYFYGDGQQDYVPNHTYTSVGTYTVTQRHFTSGFDDSVRTNYIQVKAIPPPSFKVGLCQNRVVKVTITDSQYDEYIIDYGDGTPTDNAGPGSVTTHTYSNLNTRTISVKGRYLPTLCGSSNVTATVTPLNLLIKPDIHQVMVNSQSTSGQITIRFNALSDQTYVIQQSTNNSTVFASLDTLRSISGIRDYVVSNLNTQANNYCFKILAIDAGCSSPLESEIICTIKNTVTAANAQNDIQWTAPLAGTVSNYLLYKDQGNAPLATLPSGTLQYTDNNVKCGVQYCYHVVGVYPQTNGSGQPLLSVSDKQCKTAISTNIPPAIQHLNSTVNGNSISLSWDKPVAASVSNYSVSRSENGGAYQVRANTTVNSFSDDNLSIPGNAYCYKVDYKDSCNNASQPATMLTCPVLLVATIDPNNIFQNHLSWNAYTGNWTSGIQGYFLERLDENNQVTGTLPMGNALSYTDIVGSTTQQAIRYRIRVAGNGNEISYSNISEIKYEGAVFLPTAFTPNGDGNNDSFKSVFRFIKDYHLTVYNRWGEVVFDTDSLHDGWDGNYRGREATPDAYAYLLQATDLWGKSFTQRGSVTLLR